MINKNMILLQTSDAISEYRHLLELTSQTTRLYCTDNNFHYHQFIGLKRGNQNWHATYNRIVMLNELLVSGYREWVLYMDADAWVRDLRFDLLTYLRGRKRFAIIGTAAGQDNHEYWDLNIGILLLNLAHPVAARVIHDWYGQLSRHRLEQVAVGWGEQILDDQGMLQRVLRYNPAWEPEILHEHKDFMNCPQSRFVCQAIRAEYPDIHQRTEFISSQVRRVLDDYSLSREESP